MLTKHRTFLPGTFCQKIPKTCLGICVIEQKKEKFTAVLVDLENDWSIVLYKSLAAEVLGEKIERILTM